MKFFSLFNKKNKTSDSLKKYVDPSINSTLTKEQVSEYNQQRKNEEYLETTCMAPFTNMYFSRYGEVFVCCHNRNQAIGKYPNQSIREIWDGDKSEEIRRYVKNSNLSLGCQICQLDIDRKLYAEVKANNFDQLPFNSHFPTMMEFELDITCNLECTMCSGEFSSSIRKNREHKSPFKPIYDDKFIDQLVEFIPYLHETRFSGGEPFLIPIYIDIWERMVEINPSCLISVQTNGTVLNSRIKNILKKGRFEIGVSLDSMDKKTFESIRINSKFETVKQNINYFSDYCKRKETPFRLSMCVMKNNWKEMPEYLKLCDGYDAYVSFHKVSQPVDLGIRYLDSNELSDIYIYLKNYQFDSSFTTPKSKQNLKHYYSYVEQIRIWKEKQLINEQKLCLDKEGLQQYLYTTIRNCVKNENEELIQKLDALINSYAGSSKGNLIKELVKVDALIIIQRLQFYSIQQLKDEIESLYQIKYE